MNTQRLEQTMAPFVGVGCAVLLAYGFYLYTQPVPIEIFARRADKVYVTAGDEVTISWTEVRTHSCSSVINRQLIAADGKVIFYEPVMSAEKPIGKNPDSFPFVVPPLQTAGTLTYRVKTEFQCNWVQRLFGGPKLPLPDISFEYVPTKQAS